MDLRPLRKSPVTDRHGLSRGPVCLLLYLTAWRLCKEGRLEGTKRNPRFILITKPPLRPAEATIVPTLGPRGGSHEFSPQPCPEGRREALVPADFPT